MNNNFPGACTINRVLMESWLRGVSLLRCGAVVIAGQIVLHAQPVSSPEFDVASVRAYNPQNGQRAQTAPSCIGGRFLASAPLETAILWAYKLKEFQLFDLPKWASSRDGYFAIEAKTSSAVTQDECRLMARKVLGDRFKLALHRETREIPVYELVASKNGTKAMKRAVDSDEGLGGRITINGSPLGGFVAPGSGIKGVSMDRLASMLDQLMVMSTPVDEVHRPVVDKTGLEGQYRFSLDIEIGMRGGPIPDGFSDIFTALRQQLGLELERRTEGFDVVLIDHLERPDPN